MKLVISMKAYYVFAYLHLFLHSVFVLFYTLAHDNKLCMHIQHWHTCICDINMFNFERTILKFIVINMLSSFYCHLFIQTLLMYVKTLHFYA